MSENKTFQMIKLIKNLRQHKTSAQNKTSRQHKSLPLLAITKYTLFQEQMTCTCTLQIFKRKKDKFLNTCNIIFIQNMIFVTIFQALSFC